MGINILSSFYFIERKMFMAVTPNTRIRLLKSPIELDNLNQLTFQNKEAQTNYFLSLPHIEIDNCTYQRKDDIIRFPAHIDSILEYNYVMYQNSNYSNKWFYAFIDEMTYYSDNTTYIKISTDCFQTWQFDIDVKRSFVVREHTNNDTIGANIVPEGIETGEYVVTESHPFSYLRDGVNEGDDVPNQQVLVIGVTRDPTTSGYDKIYGDSLRGTYSGAKYYAVENANSMNNLLKTYANKGFIDDVVSIFIAPIDLVIVGRRWVEYNFGSGAYSLIESDPVAESAFRGIYMTFEFPTTLDGYTPRNNKLFTKEFSYIYATNFCGSAVQYYYEYFQNVLDLDHNYCQFYLQGVLTPGCSIESLPDNYQHTHNQEYNAATFGLPAPKLPLCNWNSDQFTNWLAQNGTNRILQYAGSMAGAIMGAASGNIKTTAAGIGGILGTIAQYKTHSYAPNENNGSLNNSDVNYAHSRCFGYYSMSVSNSMARKIDRVFDAIGYATNEMKIPNITGRRNWNYVQTKSVAILGTIPQVDLQTIKDMFNNGVTFWHNPATFLDYSQNNDII
jgi:hypothetical protein